MSNRCRTDPEFALAVYERITSDRGRELFLRMYGERALRGRGSTIAELRRQATGSVWIWEAELTVPPPGE